MCIRISRRLNGVNKHSIIKEGERKEGDNTRETYTSRRNYSGTPKSKFKKCLEIQCHGLVDKGVISQAGWFQRSFPTLNVSVILWNHFWDQTEIMSHRCPGCGWKAQQEKSEPLSNKIIFYMLCLFQTILKLLQKKRFE